MAPSVAAVFLERDGVVVVNSGLPGEEPRFARGAPEAIRTLNHLGYLVVLISNQPGVARGLISEGEMHAFNSRMVRALAAREARVGAVYVCPYDAEAREPTWRHPDHPERLPNPGMITKAITERHIDPARSFLIAAGPEALEAGRAAGVSAFQFDGDDLDRFLRELLGH
jgi:D-glycero-D-manno-heptose 1,7-bisphosphate phosphatase